MAVITGRVERWMTQLFSRLSPRDNIVQVVHLVTPSLSLASLLALFMTAAQLFGA